MILARPEHTIDSVSVIGTSEASLFPSFAMADLQQRFLDDSRI